MIASGARIVRSLGAVGALTILSCAPVALTATTASAGTGRVAAACDGTGVVTDPSGDATELVVANPSSESATNQPDLDITSAYITYDATAQALTFHTVVTALGSGTPGQNFRYVFTYGGTQYTAEAGRLSGATAPSYDLLQLASGTGGQNSSIATLTGSFDATTNTVSVVLPLATFNSTATPATAPGPIALGSELDSEDILAQRDTGLITATADEAKGTCPYVVTAAPTAAAPEVPLTVGIPVAGVVAVGASWLVRRRRRGA